MRADGCTCRQQFFNHYIAFKRVPIISANLFGQGQPEKTSRPQRARKLRIAHHPAIGHAEFGLMRREEAAHFRAQRGNIAGWVKGVDGEALHYAAIEFFKRGRNLTVALSLSKGAS
jgi:hypothetical protein